MKAFVVDRYRTKSAVRLAEMPEPEVRDDDVLVRVHAASFNQLDSKIRDGELKLFCTGICMRCRSKQDLVDSFTRPFSRESRRRGRQYEASQHRDVVRDSVADAGLPL